MQDHELYRRILGIEAPWQVERVELKVQQGEVHVYLAHQDDRQWVCAVCGALAPLYDHQPEREWRHLDTCQYRTILACLTAPYAVRRTRSACGEAALGRAEQSLYGIV